MQPGEDRELLRQYAVNGCDEAFRTLVARHINLVYSVAFRQVGQAHEAEEITQAVFIILARKAARLPPGAILAGWLYQTARLTAANALRRERRRAMREQEANMRLSPEDADSVEAWQQVAPLLEDAMGALSEKERNAIVLRFLENKSLEQVGDVLGVKAGAAKMRVARALEKLRSHFARKGATLSTAVLAGALAAHSVQAAPTGLASSTVAITHSAAAATSTLALVKTTLHIMSATKTKLLIATLLALLLMVIAVACWVVVVLGPGRHQAGALTFDTLRENDIPGRYKWTEGPREFFIVLYDDHTFMNKDGTIFPTYRWEVTPTGLAITWQRNTTVFTHIEAVGFYTFDNGNRPSVRLEKLPPYAPAQLVSPAPVALLRLGALCETNGLTPVNNGDGEGDILPGNVDGGDGYRLVRKSTQADAFLYLQIAPELKDPPFTNALVIVEYFDRASASGRFGRLVIQYDDESGAYANSQPLHMTGSQAWEEATFYVATPLFQNRQNAGSDFRLAASRSELPVRSIKLFKNVNLPETKMPVRTWRRAN